jgi:hypothetical protein
VAFKDSPSNKNVKDFWSYLESTSKEVASWPTWMRGEPHTNIKCENVQREKPTEKSNERSGDQ